MIGASECDHASLARRQHRRLECRLHRLKPRVAENRLSLCLKTLDLGPWTLDCELWVLDFGLRTLDFGLRSLPPLERDAAKFPRQFRLSSVRMHIAHGVQEPRHLSLSGLDHARISVPGSGDPERRR